MVGTWQAPTVRTKLVQVRFELMCVFEAKHRVARRLLPPTPRPVTVKLFQVQVGRLRSVARTQTDLSHVRIRCARLPPAWGGRHGQRLTRGVARARLLADGDGHSSKVRNGVVRLLLPTALAAHAG